MDRIQWSRPPRTMQAMSSRVLRPSSGQCHKTGSNRVCVLILFIVFGDVQMMRFQLSLLSCLYCYLINNINP